MCVYSLILFLACLLKKRVKAYSYHTSGAMFVARRLCLLTETAYYIQIVLALHFPGDTVGQSSPTTIRGPHVACYSVFSGPLKHSEKNF